MKEKLKELLAAIASATGITPTAFTTNSVVSLPAISYTAYCTMDNGAKQQWRLQTRITADTYSDAIGIDEAIREAIVTVGDDVSIAATEVNGGGTLLDPSTSKPQQVTYYNITLRS